MPAPLSVSAVLELARILAGPWAGQVLADLGRRRDQGWNAGAPATIPAAGAPFNAGGRRRPSRRRYYHATNPARSVELDSKPTRAARSVRKPGGALRHPDRAPAAVSSAGAPAFHLDHVGAEIGEHLAGPRPPQDAGELEHAETGQRGRHQWILVGQEGLMIRRLCGVLPGFCLYGGSDFGSKAFSDGAGPFHRSET